MSRAAVRKFIKSRPSIFWWTLLNVLAATFAIASWSICLYLFGFPERPANYDILRKLERLAPVQSYDPLDAPEGESGDPAELLKKFYSLSDDQLVAQNRQFKRNYVTNFKKPKVVNYVEGAYRVTHTRPLTDRDLFHPGLAIRAQAIVETAELNESSPYPVILEILLPLSKVPDGATYPDGFVFQFTKLQNRILVLNAARIGRENEPTACLTVVPISFRNFPGPEGVMLSFAGPDPLNMKAGYPAMEQNRTE